MQKIAIIGGAGPRAGSVLFNRIIDECMRNGAWNDHDFPSIILFNVPFSPMMYNKENSVLIKQQLQEVFTTINEINCTDVVIACNTLHAFLFGVDKGSVRFYSLPELVLRSLIPYCNNDKIIIFSTPTTRDSQIYNGDRFLYPDQEIQQEINYYIESVLKGSVTIEDANKFSNLVLSTNKPVVLACTELSVLNYMYKLFDFYTHVIDPLKVVISHIL